MVSSISKTLLQMRTSPRHELERQAWQQPSFPAHEDHPKELEMSNARCLGHSRSSHRGCPIRQLSHNRHAEFAAPVDWLHHQH